jgi:hypothetical protein
MSISSGLVPPVPWKSVLPRPVPWQCQSTNSGWRSKFGCCWWKFCDHGSQKQFSSLGDGGLSFCALCLTSACRPGRYFPPAKQDPLFGHCLAIHACRTQHAEATSTLFRCERRGFNAAIFWLLENFTEDLSYTLATNILMTFSDVCGRLIDANVVPAARKSFSAP